MTDKPSLADVPVMSQYVPPEPKKSIARKVAEAVGLADKGPSREELLATRTDELRKALRKITNEGGGRNIGDIARSAGLPIGPFNRLEQRMDVTLDELVAISPYLLASGLALDPATLTFKFHTGAGDLNAGASNPKPAPEPITPIRDPSPLSGAYPTRNHLPPVNSPVLDVVEARAVIDLCWGVTEPTRIEGIRRGLLQLIPWGAASNEFPGQRLSTIVQCLLDNQVLVIARDHNFGAGVTAYRPTKAGLEWVLRFAG